MIDNSWNQAELVKGSNSKKAIKAFDIRERLAFSESARR